MRRVLLPVVMAAGFAGAVVIALSVAGGEGPGTAAVGPVGTQVPGPPPGGGTPSPATAVAERLVEALDALDRRSPRTSCLVVSDGDEPLFARRARVPLVPASATKLLTAAAFLATTGARDDDRVVRAIRESDNDAASAMLAEAGGPEVARDALGADGYDVEGVVLVDGTGLDRRNRATCRILHQVLDRAAPGSPVDDGLAVAGRSGTLADRFAGTAAEGRLRAKTGSIRGVAALAGRVTALDGATLTFVQLLGDVDARTATALQDELVSILLGERGSGREPEA